MCVCVCGGCGEGGGVNASLGSIPGDIELILLVIYQLNLEKRSSGEKFFLTKAYEKTTGT